MTNETDLDFLAWKANESGGAAEMETAVVMMQDGLMSPENVYTQSSRRYFCFCRVPAEWADGVRVKPFVMEKLFKIVYGDKWDTQKPSDGSRWIVANPSSKVFPPEEARKIDWDKLKTASVGDELFLFFKADENGELRETTETNFRAEIDQSAQKKLAEYSGYLNWFRDGAVKPDASFNSFFRALKPLLADYRGAGDYSFSFARGFDEPGMKDLFEDTATNAHGAYLKYRSCLCERDGQTEDLQVIGSNLLTHAETGDKLRVQLTLRVSLAAGEKRATLIVRFLGRDAEIERLGEAIQCALDECEYAVKLDSKRAPSLEMLKEIGG